MLLHWNDLQAGAEGSSWYRAFCYTLTLTTTTTVITTLAAVPTHTHTYKITHTYQLWMVAGGDGSARAKLRIASFASR